MQLANGICYKVNCSLGEKRALWATAYLEYEIPILLKMDDLLSYKIIFKQFKQKDPAKNCLATGWKIFSASLIFVFT